MVVQSGVKNMDDRLRNFRVMVKGGRITKVWDAGEKLPNIYGD
jgi:hypothetical protein